MLAFKLAANKLSVSGLNVCLNTTKATNNLKLTSATTANLDSLKQVLINLVQNRGLASSTSSTGVGDSSRNISTSSTANNSAFTNIYSSDQKTAPNFGFLFDIDGVLVRGKTLLPKTRACIQMLTDSNGNFRVPTLFVTNAGNEMRSSKSAKLSSLLGVYIHPDQVVMSHSPLRMLTSFHNKRCLISGQGPIVEIAKNLGFTSVITVEDLRQYYPHLDVVDHKRRVFAPCVLGNYFPPIEAIVLFGESIRWETSLQLIIDVLMCNGRLDQAPKKFPFGNLPILACNTDLIWMAEANMPRFGHGTFLHCLEQIYSKLSGKELKYSAIVGKPSEITYYYAESMIQKHAKSIGINGKIKHLYAIGDNLDTDIYGANVYNQILESNKRIREKKNSSQQQKKLVKSKQVLLRNEINSRETNAVDLIDENSEEYSLAENFQNSKQEPAEQRQQQKAEQQKQIQQQQQNEEEQNKTGSYSSLTLEQSISFLNEKDSFLTEAESIDSILVSTGVYQGQQINIENDSNQDSAEPNYAHKDMIIDNSLKQPHFMCDNAYDAVKLVYQLRKFS